VQVVSDFVKQNTSDGAIAGELPVRQRPVRQLSDDIVHDDFNPGRLPVPCRMIETERLPRLFLRMTREPLRVVATMRSVRTMAPGSVNGADTESSSRLTVRSTHSGGL
jgi:hypothetical protein